MFIIVSSCIMEDYIRVYVLHQITDYHRYMTQMIVIAVIELSHTVFYVYYCQMKHFYSLSY